MSRRFSALVTTVALAAVVTAAPAPAAVVSLTVESSTAPAPLFEGTVETQPHEVDGGDGSGGHPCWGPPGATPAPTATGALDDAMRAAGISWRGNWHPSFRDFFVDRIGPYASASPDGYWSLTVNDRFSGGGCLTRVVDGDAVRFRYGFSFPPGPASAGGASQPPNATPVIGGGNDAVAHHRTGRQIRRLAAGATTYLRRATGAGEEWAELALALRARRDPTGAARQLGERLRALPGKGPTPQDVDSAALDAWALAVRGRQAKARRLAAFVRSAQAADGGFPTMPGGASNAQSTGVALIALRVTGLGPRPSADPGAPTPLDYLASLVRPDGSIPYDGSASPTPVWSTAQALLGLTSKEKLLDLDSGGAAG